MSFHHDQICVATGVSNVAAVARASRPLPLFTSVPPDFAFEELEDVRLDPQRDPVLRGTARDDLLRVLLHLRERLAAACSGRARPSRTRPGCTRGSGSRGSTACRRAPCRTRSTQCAREELRERVVIGVDARLHRHHAPAVDHPLHRRVLGLEQVGQVVGRESGEVLRQEVLVVRELYEGDVHVVLRAVERGGHPLEPVGVGARHRVPELHLYRLRRLRERVEAAVGRVHRACAGCRPLGRRGSAAPARGDRERACDRGERDAPFRLHPRTVRTGRRPGQVRKTRTEGRWALFMRLDLALERPCDAARQSTLRICAWLGS